MVATGAVIGTGIAPGIGTAIGAGLGGIATFVAGNKLADSISGVSKTTAQLNEEAEKLGRKDMAKRFGKWQMSADELSRSVKRIVGADTINRLDKFNNSMSDLESIQTSLSDNKYTIDYAGAMIKGGGKLSPSDINEYKTALEGYASATKDLLTTNKKSTRSAFQLLYGDDTKGMAKMTKGMEGRYSGLEKKLSKKSKKLNDVIAKAFEDGKITINEQKKIDELVGQIEDIQEEVEKRTEKIAKAESDASYDLIKQKYQYEKLTPESFKSLVGELDSQNEKTLKGYDDAYVKAKAEIDVEFEEGEISEAKYKKKLKEIENKWRQGKADTIHKSINVSLDVVKTNYKDSFSKIKDALSGDSLKLNANQMINETTISANGLEHATWGKDSKAQLDEMKSSFLKEAGISKKMQSEMKEIYKSLKPQEQDLLELKKSYEDAGQKVPQWIEDSLSDIENIKLMSGDSNSFYSLIGEKMAKEDSSHAKQLLADKGSELPKALKEGIEKGLKEVEGKTKPVEVKTNLKLKADKKNIDTSNLDKSTKSVVNKLKDKGVIKINKNGEVKIKTKDGKIDTSGLDKKTKKAVRDLEKKGVLKIDKNGNVKVKAKKVDTKDAEKKTKEKTKKNLGKKQNVNKKANVKVKQKTDTSNAKKKSNDKIKKEMGKKLSLDKKATVNVKDDTKTADAKKSSESKIKSDLKGPVSANTKTNVTANFGGFNGTLASLKSKVFGKIKSSLSSTTATTTVNIKARRFGGPTSDQQEGHNANGSRIDRETLTWVGENNNREYIIPTTSGKRQRGLSLWMEAGKDLGVIHNADGGVYGGHSGSGSRFREMLNNTENNRSSSVDGSDAPQKASGSGKVEINVGGIKIEIASSGNGAASDIENNIDKISGALAEAIEKAWQNIPLAIE